MAESLTPGGVQVKQGSWPACSMDIHGLHTMWSWGEREEQEKPVTSVSQSKAVDGGVANQWQVCRKIRQHERQRERLQKEKRHGPRKKCAECSWWELPLGNVCLTSVKGWGRGSGGRESWNVLKTHSWRRYETRNAFLPLAVYTASHCFANGALKNTRKCRHKPSSAKK